VHLKPVVKPVKEEHANLVIISDIVLNGLADIQCFESCQVSEE